MYMYILTRDASTEASLIIAPAFGVVAVLAGPPRKPISTVIDGHRALPQFPQNPQLDALSHPRRGRRHRKALCVISHIARWLALLAGFEHSVGVGESSVSRGLN